LTVFHLVGEIFIHPLQLSITMRLHAFSTMTRTIKLERTDERLTRRGSLIFVNRFGDKIHLSRLVDRAFGKPGSNRGFPASEFVIPLMEMAIDGATPLEDIQLFEDDEAYKELADVFQYPSADAIGDWLRRYGTAEGETALSGC